MQQSAHQLEVEVLGTEQAPGLADVEKLGGLVKGIPEDGQANQVVIFENQFRANQFLMVGVVGVRIPVLGIQGSLDVPAAYFPAIAFFSLAGGVFFSVNMDAEQQQGKGQAGTYCPGATAFGAILGVDLWKRH